MGIIIDRSQSWPVVRDAEGIRSAIAFQNHIAAKSAAPVEPEWTNADTVWVLERVEEIVEREGRTGEGHE